MCVVVVEPEVVVCLMKDAERQGKDPVCQGPIRANCLQVSAVQRGMQAQLIHTLYR